MTQVLADRASIEMFCRQGTIDDCLQVATAAIGGLNRGDEDRNVTAGGDRLCKALELEARSSNSR